MDSEPFQGLLLEKQVKRSQNKANGIFHTLNIRLRLGQPKGAMLRLAAIAVSRNQRRG
jgi:hypothetical protein